MGHLNEKTEGRAHFKSNWIKGLNQCHQECIYLYFARSLFYLVGFMLMLIYVNQK